MPRDHRPQRTVQPCQVVDDLIGAFTRVEAILHTSGMVAKERYVLVLQLLVLRLAIEENLVDPVPPSSQNKAAARELRTLERKLATGLKCFRDYLPSNLIAPIKCSRTTLARAWHEISAIRVRGASAEVLQRVFMQFGPALTKSDLGQFFTPLELIDFVVGLVNPRPGETVLEPACGVADFLIGARRFVKTTYGVDSTDEWAGVDVSGAAVELARLNLFLHGIRQTQIVHDDALTLGPISARRSLRT